jgi:hypothetical protein
VNFWFKIHHDARADIKLRKLTDAQFRVWFNLLCYASEQEERGVIRAGREIIALEVADENLELLEETLSRLSRLNIVTVTNDTISFIHWEDRQKPAYPSDEPEATRLRKQKQREQERARRDDEIETSTEALNGHDTSRVVTSSHECCHDQREDKAEAEKAFSTKKQSREGEGEGKPAAAHVPEEPPALPAFGVNTFFDSALPADVQEQRKSAGDAGAPAGDAPTPPKIPPETLRELMRGLLTESDLADLLKSSPKPGEPRWTAGEVMSALRKLKARIADGKKRPDKVKAYLFAALLPEVRAEGLAPPPPPPKPPPRIAPAVPEPEQLTQEQIANRDKIQAQIARIAQKASLRDVPTPPPE